MSASPLSLHVIGRKRWAMGIAVMYILGILGALQAILSEEQVWVVQRVVGYVVGVPMFLVPLFASFNWAARRRLSSALTLLTSVAVAEVVGVAFTVGAWAVLTRFPHLMPPVRRLPTYPRVAGIGLVLGVGMCALWAFAFVFPFATEDARLRGAEAEKLKLEAEKLKLEAETLRSASELGRLRAQLEPHFMLNTLNAIAGLVTQDPREARRLIACLGDLLRDAVRDGDEMQTLDEEVAWLRRYAEILESRHAGSLRFRWEIEERAGDVLVPRLLLQPLVENAVKHGALRRDEGGQVLIRAVVKRPEGGPARLVCTVEDNGPGISERPPRSGAFGLNAVRRRIELKYADGCMHLDSSPHGTRVVVELPCAAPGPTAIDAAREVAR